MEQQLKIKDEITPLVIDRKPLADIRKFLSEKKMKIGNADLRYLCLEIRTEKGLLQQVSDVQVKDCFWSRQEGKLKRLRDVRKKITTKGFNVDDERLERLYKEAETETLLRASRISLQDHGSFPPRT